MEMGDRRASSLSRVGNRGESPSRVGLRSPNGETEWQAKLRRRIEAKSGRTSPNKKFDKPPYPLFDEGGISDECDKESDEDDSDEEFSKYFQNSRRTTQGDRSTPGLRARSGSVRLLPSPTRSPTRGKTPKTPGTWRSTATSILTTVSPKEARAITWVSSRSDKTKVVEPTNADPCGIGYRPSTVQGYTLPHVDHSSILLREDCRPIKATLRRPISTSVEQWKHFSSEDVKNVSFDVYCEKNNTFAEIWSQGTTTVRTHRGNHLRPVQIEKPSVYPYIMRLKQDRNFWNGSMPVQIIELQPNYGGAGGNTRVEITGTGFPSTHAAKSSCRISFIPLTAGESESTLHAEDVQYLSSTKILVLTPPARTHGRYKVVVTVNRRQSQVGECANNLFFFQGPSVSNIKPRHADVGGGTQISVIGRFLEPGPEGFIEIKVGNRLCTGVVSDLMDGRRVKGILPPMDPKVKPGEKLEVSVYVTSSTRVRRQSKQAANTTFHYTLPRDTSNEQQYKRIKVDEAVFSHMHVSIVPLLTNYLKSRLEQIAAEMKEFLGTIYHQLRDIFWYYVMQPSREIELDILWKLTPKSRPIPNVRQRTNGMFLEHFHTFANDSRLFGPRQIGKKSDEKILEAIFEQHVYHTPPKQWTGCEDDKQTARYRGDNEDNSINFTQFLAALYSIAEIKYPDASNISRRFQMAASTILRYCRSVESQEPFLKLMIQDTTKEVLRKQVNKLNLIFQYYSQPVADDLYESDCRRMSFPMLRNMLIELKVVKENEAFRGAGYICQTFMMCVRGKWATVAEDHCQCIGRCTCSMEDYVEVVSVLQLEQFNVARASMANPPTVTPLKMPPPKPFDVASMSLQQQRDNYGTDFDYENFKVGLGMPQFLNHMDFAEWVEFLGRVILAKNNIVTMSQCANIEETFPRDLEKLIVHLVKRFVARDTFGATG